MATVSKHVGDVFRAVIHPNGVIVGTPSWEVSDPGGVGVLSMVVDSDGLGVTLTKEHSGTGTVSVNAGTSGSSLSDSGTVTDAEATALNLEFE